MLHIFTNATPEGLSLMTVGYDYVDVAAATKYKIPVSNTPGV